MFSTMLRKPLTGKKVKFNSMDVSVRMVTMLKFSLNMQKYVGNHPTLEMFEMFQR